MRTTLTLDADVAAALDRFRQRGDHTLKEAVNQALRLGLRSLEAEPATRVERRTDGVSLGGCLIGSLDDVAEVLAVSEGEAFP